MKNREASFRDVSFLLMLCVLIMQAGTAFSEERSVAVVVSKRIKPYMQVLKGVEQGLEQDNLEVFFLSSSKKRDRARVSGRLLEKPYDLFLAIGPEAGELVWSVDELSGRGKIFSAILNPDGVLGEDTFGCGISLQIPVEVQIEALANAFPDVDSLGLLFDRKQNQRFFVNALAAGEAYGLNIIPLAVDSKKQIPEILKVNLDSVDCIWMVPDETVISEKIVQYVIKQALYRKKGVVGYNSFFIRSGAVFAFEFDYTEIGLQTADRIKAYFDRGECWNVPPLFHRTVNTKMTRTLGLRVEE
ncbi:MAG: ABC transporter substrate-binding protein [Desulfobacteraceae bacterium]|nr:ABC transporter substrate-binding protein [Desulfobacteraceae bacterium]